MYEDIKEVESKFEIKDFPLNVAIEIGNYCNLNCIMCNNDKLTRKRGFMSTLLYRKIIDEVAQENPYARIWLDFYGEPLLAKYKLYYMIDYAKKKGCKSINMNTNAMLLDEEMAEMLLDSGIDFVSVDCFGYSKEVLEKISGGADRDTVYRNAEYFLKRKQERKAKTNIEIKVIEMEENKDEVQKILDYWRAKSAWTTKRRLISWGGTRDDLKTKKNIERVACGNGIGVIAITWDGNVTNCNMDADASHVFGNVAEESIKDIWLRRNRELISKHIEHRWDELPEICKNCTDWLIIGEERFDENGNPVLKNYQHNSEML